MGYLIPSDWDGETWCTAVICWPKSEGWLSILRGLVTSLTRGRNWDGESGSIVSAQVTGYQILDENFETGCDVTCLDDLTVSLQALVNATLQASSCGCGGSGGAGGVPQDPSDFVDNGETFPEGYDDRAAYDVAKCNLAQYVINNILADLDRLKTIDPTTLTLAGVVALLPVFLLVPFSFVVLALIAAAIIALASVSASAFVTAVTELRARFAAMDICVLYEAATVEDAVAMVEGWITTGTYSTQTLTENLGVLLIGTDALNPLFNPPDPWLLQAGLPTGDCSGCESTCQAVHVEIGTVTAQTATSLTVSSELSAGLHRVEVYWNVEETSPGNFAYCWDGVEVTNISVTNNLVGGTAYNNPDNNVIDTFHMYPPNANLPSLPFADVGRILMSFNTAESGSVTFTWNNPTL